VRTCYHVLSRRGLKAGGRARALVSPEDAG